LRPRRERCRSARVRGQLGARREGILKHDGSRIRARLALMIVTGMLGAFAAAGVPGRRQDERQRRRGVCDRAARTASAGAHVVGRWARRRSRT